MKPFKDIISYLLFFFLLTGCQKLEYSANQDGLGFIKNSLITFDSKSRIIATRKNAAVEIKLNYYDFQFWKEINSNQSYPDYYEVYMSIDGTDWDFVKTVDTSFINKSFIISDLQNDKLYYLYLKEINDNGKTSKNTNVVLFVPSAFKPVYSFILKDYFEHDIYSFDINTSDKTIVYGTKFYEYQQNYAAPAIFAFGSDNKAQLVDINCWFPDFNNDGTLIAYSSNKGEKFDGNLLPEHIVLYDISNKQFTSITSGYSVNKYPVWSPISSRLAYSSSEKSDIDLKITVFDPRSSNKIILQNPIENDRNILGYSQVHPDWSSDEKYIYYTHWYYTSDNFNPGYYDIYRIKSDGGIPEAVFKSNWTECMPSISPDNSKIAFLTDLTGQLQIWIYDFIKGKFQEPFDTRTFYFSEVWSKIKWRDNNSLLFTAYSEEYGGDSSLFLITVE